MKQRKYETAKVRDKESAKQWKYETKKVRNNKVRNNESEKQRICDTTKVRNNERTKSRKYKTTKVRSKLSTKQQMLYKCFVFAGMRRQIVSYVALLFNLSKITLGFFNCLLYLNYFKSIFVFQCDSIHTHHI